MRALESVLFVQHRLHQYIRFIAFQTVGHGANAIIIIIRMSYVLPALLFFTHESFRLHATIE